MFRKCAGVAELADAPDSKSGARKGVEVQVLSPVLGFAVFFSILRFVRLGTATQSVTRRVLMFDPSTASAICWARAMQQ